MLLAVPNFSEGRDRSLIDRISTEFASGAELLDTHSDSLHNRTVLTLAAPAPDLGDALGRGAEACIGGIDMKAHDGAHPCVGALDVCPVVWLDEEDREAAVAEALAVATSIAAGGVPVFLYGELASSPERRERAFFRAGGLARLAERMAAGELTPDLGPSSPHPSAGATLVTVRPPLAAFNLEIEGIRFDVAQGAAAGLRESGGGLPGVRAIAIDRGGERAQISTNVHDPLAVALAQVVDRVRKLIGPAGGQVAAAEIVGLVPQAALVGFPEDVPIPGFDPRRHVIEARLRP
jgi:glutamate formiminotransferase / 5-formyltetrahydrofolate cyclo-ligase